MRLRTLILVAVSSIPVFGQLSVQISGSLSTAPRVGVPVTFTAVAVDANPGPLDYRFSVSQAGASYQTVVDFSSANTFVWVPSLHEGSYSVQVIARNKTAGEQSTAQIQFDVPSPIIGNQPAVTATANPLVALYSAPPCPAGRFISVVFGTGNAFAQTDQRACSGTMSTNFYIAGMLPNTAYQIYSVLSSDRRHKWIPVHPFATNLRAQSFVGPEFSPPLTFTTEAIPANLSFAAFSVLTPPTAQASDQRILLNDSIAVNSYAQGLYYFPTATDLSGNIIWYYGDIGTFDQSTDYFIRPVDGGTFLLIAADTATVAVKGQLLREIDLAGNIVRETNVTRVSEQLGEAGMLGIIDFNHDAIRLPNGHTLVNCSQEKIFPAGTQGSRTPIDLIGNAIVDLDADFQVAWAWSAYDHLDVNRAAILGETCQQRESGCAPITLADTAEDWTHGNSIYYIPSSGDLLFSMRHQDWVVRIDYQDGKGSGAVLWKLGRDGSFSFVSSDPYPWFSHQHDARYAPQGTLVMSLFDNGNTRAAENPGIVENSRGMVLSLDESAFTATPLLSQDLGVSAGALGSSQRLDNGDYHFDAGFVSSGGNQVAQHSEYSLAGVQNYLVQTGALSYRSYRMLSLYLTGEPGN